MINSSTENLYMKLILSDGKVKTFTSTIEQFSQLRYATAKVRKLRLFRYFHDLISLAAIV